MINSPEAQFQYALKLPMQELTSIMQGKPSQISQSVAMMAMQKLKATRTAMQGQQAQQQLNKPSVKDQLVQESQMPESQGIGQLAAQNMNEVVRVAQGGIIGFSGGGLEGKGLANPEEEPFDPAYYLKAPFKAAGRKYMELMYPSPEAPKDLSAQNAGFTTNANGEPIPISAPMAGGTISPLMEPPTAPGPQAPRTAAPMRGAATPTPSVPGQRQPAYPGDILEPQTPQQGIATLSPAPTTVPRTSETFDALQTKFSGTTKPYMDEMTAAMKALTDSPEEKSARGEKRSGVMMMKAAGKLLAGGRSGAASRGEALSSVGDLAQEYAKEDDAAKRAQIGAKMTMLGAQAQLAQGDNKAAMDMFQHAQNLDQKYAHLEASKAQDAAMNASRDKGHDIDRQRMEGDRAYRSAMIRITEPLNKAHARYYEALGAAGATRGQLTEKDLANFRDKATDNVRGNLVNNPVLQAKANKDPVLMQQLIATEFARLTEKNPSALKPAPSIQLPDSAAGERRVFD